MGRKETFQQLNLISQKNKKIILFLILISIGIFIFLKFVPENSCGIQHILLLNDIDQYKNTLDPEFCMDLLYRIENFNSQCQPEIEILDCG